MGDESKQIIKDRLAELPEKLKAFVLTETWREGVAKVGRQFNLKEEQMTSLENEVFLTLLCFEPPSDFKENIKREVSLDENAGRRIADSINGTVFASIMGEIKNAWGGAKPTQKEQEYKPIDNLDSEKMVRAMQKAGEAPANLPTEKVDQPRVIHDYVSKPDPYREPLE